MNAVVTVDNTEVRALRNQLEELQMLVASLQVRIIALENKDAAPNFPDGGVTCLGNEEL